LFRNLRIILSTKSVILVEEELTQDFSHGSSKARVHPVIKKKKI